MLTANHRGMTEKQVRRNLARIGLFAVAGPLLTSPPAKQRLIQLLDNRRSADATHPLTPCKASPEEMLPLVKAGVICAMPCACYLANAKSRPGRSGLRRSTERKDESIVGWRSPTQRR